MVLTPNIINAYVFIDRDTEVKYDVRPEGDQVVISVGPNGEFELVLDRDGLNRWAGVVAEAREVLDQSEAELDAEIADS